MAASFKSVGVRSGSALPKDVVCTTELVKSKSDPWP